MVESCPDCQAYQEELMRTELELRTLREHARSLELVIIQTVSNDAKRNNAHGPA